MIFRSKTVSQFVPSWGYMALRNNAEQGRQLLLLL